MGTTLKRRLNITATGKLTSGEFGALANKADAAGLTVSEYLRRLVLNDQKSATDDRLLLAIEAEHIRLMILAAQAGKKLDDKTIHELRSQATTSARALVEQTLRLVRQT